MSPVERSPPASAWHAVRRPSPLIRGLDEVVTLLDLSGVEGDSSSGVGGDASELLRVLVSHRLPGAVLREARAAGAEQVALYVMDIDGSRLIRLGGDEQFPDRIPAPLGLGPELPLETLDQVEEIVSSKVPRASVIPLSIRDRAVGVLVTCGQYDRAP